MSDSTLAHPGRVTPTLNEIFDTAVTVNGSEPHRKVLTEGDEVEAALVDWRRVRVPVENASPAPQLASYSIRRLDASGLLH